MNSYFLMKTFRIQIFVFLCLFLSQGLLASEKEPPTKPFVVVLDAGHGGKDPGTMGNGYKEKDIALSIILKIGKELEKNPSINVIYTRDTDVFVTLKGRAEAANQAKADLFVSVHCNSSASQARGTETFVLGLHRNADNLKIAMKENSVIYLEEDYKVNYDGFDPNSPASYIGMTLMQEEYLDQSILLADDVQKEFTNNLKRVDRGVKQAGFLVLRETYMPSVLIETGFLTNNSEGKFLNSSAGQQKMANAIVEGIKAYKNSINMYSTEVTRGKAEVPTPETPGALGNTEIPQKEAIYKKVVFKVQIGAGSTALATKSYNFKGLEGIERNKEGKLYKYYYGSTSDYLKAQRLQMQAKEKGYKNCYLVAFKDGKKISVNEALKTKLK